MTVTNVGEQTGSHTSRDSVKFYLQAVYFFTKVPTRKVTLQWTHMYQILSTLKEVVL